MESTQFTIRRKILTIFGAKFHIYNADGALLGFCKQKAFRLKEDIRVYTDETAQEERIVIAARSVIDFGASYDVVDSREQRKVGALRRKGLRSLFRDEWQVLDEHDQMIGTIREESGMLAFLRRMSDWLSLIPQKFHLIDGSGQEYAQFRTHFNPFVHRMTVTVLPECPISPYLVLAAGILLVAIEGRQQ